MTMTSTMLEDRMRSISTNAVQEGRVAKGRGGMPFLDKDSRIQDMIERLLHELTPANEVNASEEHYPLVEQIQPEIGKRITSMSEILNKLEEDLIEKPAKLAAPSKTTVKK